MLKVIRETAMGMGNFLYLFYYSSAGLLERSNNSVLTAIAITFRLQKNARSVAALRAAKSLP